MKTNVLAVLAALSLLAPLPALAQYRDGPAVITPRPQADPDAGANATLARFAAWNTQARKPKMIVWWNRELSDQTASQAVESSQTTDERRVGRSLTGDTTATQFGSARKENEETVDTRVATTTTTSGMMSAGTYAALDPLASRVLETTFVNTYMMAGAQIIDRDALVRSVSTRVAPGERADLQFIESKALTQGIEYLIEVLPDKSTTSPTGMIFSVSIKHMPTSRIVAQFLTAGAPPPGPMRRVASESGGYTRVQDNRITPERVAAQVAVDSMQRLADWRR